MLAAGVVGAWQVRADTGRGSRPVTSRRPPGRPTTTTTAPPASSSVPTTSAAPPAPVPPEVTAAVHQLMAFVETARGLHFKADVPVALLDDAAFRAKVAAGAGVSAADATKLAKVLHALGLLAANTDVAGSEERLTAGAVIGLYDPKSRSLLVRGAALTPLVRYTLVHELTHALQDQWFGLDRPDLAKRNDESPLAFSALVEGDAVRIQTKYLNSLPKVEQDSITQAENAVSPNVSSVPDVLVQLLYFPYQYGVRFVNTLVAVAGQARLDAAFKDPPTTSAQILHPDRFAASGDPPVPVAQPAGEGTFVDNGPLGQFGFFLMLHSKLDATTSARAADGWAGDNYVAYDAGGQTCVRDSVVTGSSSGLSALDAALHSYAARRTGVTIQGPTGGTGPYQWTACA